MKGISILQIFCILLCSGIAYYVYDISKEVEQLHQDNEVLWNKLDSLQHSPALSRKNVTRTLSKPTTLIDYLVSESEKSEREAKAAEAKKKIKVTATYRLEDRYVSNKVSLPEYVGNTAGKIVLDIAVNTLGYVSSAKLNPASDISDEETVEAAKKAALRTSFNIHFDAPESQAGTITYTYTKK